VTRYSGSNLTILSLLVGSILGAQVPPANRPAAIPGRLSLQPGSLVAAQINQHLSSDRNEVGEVFSVTLDQPVVVDGLVVAARGQIAGGRVVEVSKGGRISGAARLGIRLTDLTLVDGQRAPILSQVNTRKARSSTGWNVGMVVGLASAGAAVGAFASPRDHRFGSSPVSGKYMGLGAGAGLGAGILGALLMHGQPAVIHRGAVLTFQIETPVVINTERAPQAFHPVAPEDYQRVYELPYQEGAWYPYPQ